MTYSMKRLAAGILQAPRFHKLVLGGVVFAATSTAGIYSAAADSEPGTFTQCVAWNNGITYAIINPGFRDRCFQMARNCSGNPNVRVTWYSSPVMVQTPYTQCAMR
jgi:hypothetical protein